LTDDFGYLNTRIRNRRCQLLPEAFFQEAMQLSFGELVKTLGETPYGPDFTGEALADIDRGVSRHLYRTVSDLPGMVAGSAREAVSLILVRSDLANVKTILRGRKNGWSVEDITSRLTAGTLSPALYGALTEAADAASMAQLLRLPQHPLAKALREAAATSQDPLEIEVMLDCAFYPLLLRRARQLDQPYLAGFLAVEIDALNLSMGLKLYTLGLKGQPDRFFLPGGRLVGRPLFLRLTEGEVAALEELGDSNFRPAAGARDLTSLERGLRCVLLTKARQGAKDVLGAGLANDYIQRKEWEASRIRLLARRAYYDLPLSVVETEVSCQ
jgi:V/A-type H+/Na+-transporting ATPase subunit C